MKNKDNLTNTPPLDDTATLAEAAQKARNEPGRRTEDQELKKPEDKDRLRDNRDFIDFVSQNLWTDRRAKGWPWKANVVDFLHTTYSKWLKNGLYRSDFRLLDPKLYAMLNKHLHALESEDEKLAVLEDLGILPEFGEAAINRIEDPIERARTDALRRYHRERTQRYRASQKNL